MCVHVEEQTRLQAGEEVVPGRLSCIPPGHDAEGNKTDSGCILRRTAGRPGILQEP